MYRSHFIKISGVSLAGLIINAPVFANMPPSHLLALPHKVFIQSGNQLPELSSSDKSKWIIKDVEVLVKEIKNVQAANI